MTSRQLRQSFLDFFESRSHRIVSSSSLLPDAPNLLFTNAGMNQFVPIFLEQETFSHTPARAADTQKCIRAGGKHNDLEDVGFDTYHHTFFEMLGNWSFGDYFKKEAIEWAWELITEVWKFPKFRLYATVYKPAEGDPAEFDQEAYDLWARLFKEAGLDPERHIVFGNKTDNFWMMGETGPCGPCSEIHFDLTPRGDTAGALVNKGTAECIEIWNLVFIQFNADAEGGFSPLPACHVDTGMGFERIAAVMQCTNNFTDFTRKISNYDSDIFRPIFKKLEQLCGLTYEGTFPNESSLHHRNKKLQADIAFRVIADHIRTLSFAIADGIHPGNTFRHYVLRRILRRAVMYGRSLNLHEPFFYRLVEVLDENMGDVFPEIRERREHIEEVIRLEEEAFNRTLDRGIERFQAEMERLKSEDGKIFSGDFAFELSDTYGFPLDLTQLMAREQNFEVDEERFQELMEAQRAQARQAQKREVIEVSDHLSEISTDFTGFENLEVEEEVAEIVQIKDRVAVITRSSPFYAAMGGQVGDTGEMDHGGRLWVVSDTQKAGKSFLHFLESPDDTPGVGEKVILRVDQERRRAIERHHTATHLLHWALHEVVSKEASQKGSQVGQDKLTFDFNCKALTASQISEVEKLVNERILENTPVSWMEMKHSEVKARKDIMQFFGDKYGELVRIVQIGGEAQALDGYSMELCGGTHVRHTGELGIFKILSEGAISAGIRRIEARAGTQAYQTLLDDHLRLSRLADLLNTPANEIEVKVDSLLQRGKDLEKALARELSKHATGRVKEFISAAETCGSVPAVLQSFKLESPDELQKIGDALKADFKGVAVLAGLEAERVHLLVFVEKSFQDKFSAGKLLQALAPIVGGRGGGKSEMARGAGKDADAVPRLLAKAKEVLSVS
ncbi:MAG: alanine--tRNA ligase [Chthoniobacterales bacterium]